MNARAFIAFGVLVAGVSFACSPEVVTPGAASPNAASAEHQYRVVLLEQANGGEASVELLAHVRRELRTAGLEVVSRPAPMEKDPAWLVETNAAELHAAAVIFVIERPAEGNEPRRVELWLSDRRSRRTFVRNLPLDAEDTEESYRRVAVQVVELLKARVADLMAAPGAEPSAASPIAATSSSATAETGCSNDCALAKQLANEGDRRHKVDLDGSIALYERAIALDPKNHLFYWKLANAVYKKGDFERVRATLERAVELAPNAASYFRLLGEVELTLARDRSGYERAKAALERCIENDPAMARCHALLGDARQSTEESDAAIDSYKKAIELDAWPAEPYLALAELYAKRGDSTRAEDVIEEGLRVATSSDRTMPILFRLCMLRADLLRKRADKAGELAALETAAKYADILHPETEFELGSAYARLGPPGRDAARKHLTSFWKRVCRGSAAARFEKECSAANALMQKL